MGSRGIVIRNVYVVRFMTLVSLLGLLGQLALSDSGIDHKGIKPELFSDIGSITLNTRDEAGPDRIGVGPTTCSSDDINIVQGQNSTPGIPTFTVTIMNLSVKGCIISNLHLSCGWFSSANLVDPNIFRRLKFNDCLVKDGGNIDPSETLSFLYSNTRPYPLTVSSIKCGCYS